MALDYTKYSQAHRNVSFGSDRLDILTRVEMEEQGLPDRSELVSALLLPHPDDDLSSGEDTPRWMGGRSYVRQYIYMGAWFFTLLLGYLVERLACRFNLPTDCVRNSTYYETFSDVTNLALYGLALGWAVGLTERPRFLWIFNLRRWYAGIIFLATPAAYSAISNVDVLKHDLVDFSSWGAPFIALWSVAMVSIAGVVAWHVRSAWRRCSPAGFAVYVAFRALVFTWFGVSAIALEHSNPPVRVHLHHLYIGWALALWADVNSPLSAVTLAIGAGIFVQGVAAYSFAPIFTADGCFETPSSAAIKCKFWNESPFTLNICPAAGSVPRHQCD